MGMRPAARMPKLTRRSRTLIAIALTVIGLLLVGPRFIDAYVDWLWFGELGYRSVFTTVLLTARRRCAPQSGARWGHLPPAGESRANQTECVQLKRRGQSSRERS